MGWSRIRVTWEECGRTQERKERYNRDGEVMGDQPGRVRESEVAGGESCGKGKLRVVGIVARGRYLWVWSEMEAGQRDTNETLRNPEKRRGKHGGVMK